MLKPQGLGRLLLATVPGLKDNPDRLQLFIDRGRIASRATRSLAFEYRYTLNIVVQDYTGEIDAIIVPLLAWISEQQPDLLEREPNEPFSFEAELLDGGAADVSIDLDLSERVGVTRRDGGGFDIEHYPEPPSHLTDLDSFPGVCGVNLWQLFLRDELIAQSADPVFRATL